MEFINLQFYKSVVLDDMKLLPKIHRIYFMSRLGVNSENVRLLKCVRFFSTNDSLFYELQVTTSEIPVVGLKGLFKGF